MVENEYLVHERSTHDRRSIRVRLSPKGLELYGRMKVMFQRHIEELEAGPHNVEELRQSMKALRHLEQFWTRLLALGLRGQMSKMSAA
jgi:DNA-binding MarR family transcriptional regulator